MWLYSLRYRLGGIVIYPLRSKGNRGTRLFGLVLAVVFVIIIAMALCGAAVAIVIFAVVQTISTFVTCILGGFALLGLVAHQGLAANDDS